MYTYTHTHAHAHTHNIHKSTGAHTHPPFKYIRAHNVYVQLFVNGSVTQPTCVCARHTYTYKHTSIKHNTYKHTQMHPTHTGYTDCIVCDKALMHMSSIIVLLFFFLGQGGQGGGGRRQIVPRIINIKNKHFDCT